MEVFKDNKDKFGINFDENKEVLNNISTIRSKILKNELAGYITKLIRNELMAEAQKTKSISNEEELVTESESKETIAPESKETIAPESKETIAPESKETIAPEHPQVSGSKDSTKDVLNTNKLED